MNNQESKADIKFRESIVKTLAEYTSKQISANVKRAMLNKAKSGYSMYRPPVGYKVSEVKGIHKITRHGRAMSDLMKRFANDEVMADEFHFTLCILLHHTANPFKSKAGLKRLLSNPYYAGFISFNGELYKGKHEPLVTPEEQKVILEKLTK